MRSCCNSNRKIPSINSRLHSGRLRCVHCSYYIISFIGNTWSMSSTQTFVRDWYLSRCASYGPQVFNHAVGDSPSVDFSGRLRRVGIPATTMGHENTARYARKLCPGRRADVQAGWTDISRRTEGSQAMGNPKWVHAIKPIYYNHIYTYIIYLYIH